MGCNYLIRSNLIMFSIVMPAYNEGTHIYENLLKTNEIVSSFCDDFEIVCVNDGSADNTEAEIKRAAEECSSIHMVSYTPNGGKGHAIKTGVLEAKGDVIGFLDSDLDLSPDHFEDFLSHMKSENADVVIGSKMHKESKLEYPFIRKFVSFGYYVMLRVLFHLKVHDTQTGVKVYRADILKKIVPDVITKGFAYDIELLAVANEMGAKIIERPIRLVFTREGGFSRIRFKDIWQVFKDTFRIKKKVRKIRKENRKAGKKHA
ncbi:MAG: glycosyltransferase family 2 protein [Clostridiales bacterium]|nr:glycosyltransferase family 2 protein [Clostridiales bacterium]